MKEQSRQKGYFPCDKSVLFMPHSWFIDIIYKHQSVKKTKNVTSLRETTCTWTFSVTFGSGYPWQPTQWLRSPALFLCFSLLAFFSAPKCHNVMLYSLQPTKYWVFSFFPRFYTYSYLFTNFSVYSSSWSTLELRSVCLWRQWIL